MGNKINPIGLRLGIIKGWESSWYGGKDFSEKIVEDQKIRNYISLRIPRGGISKVVINWFLRITFTFPEMMMYRESPCSPSLKM